MTDPSIIGTFLPRANGKMEDCWVGQPHLLIPVN